MPSGKAAKQFTEEEVQAWGVKEVVNWLVANKLESCTEDFMSLQIDGQRLLVSIGYVREREKEFQRKREDRR